ncbi:MAG: phosphodiester glycosidase family protein, partial [Clostridia bacterium]|nr:phosphodiester glycosidase family protein [Clostridia bacterium]
RICAWLFALLLIACGPGLAEGLDPDAFAVQPEDVSLGQDFLPPFSPVYRDESTYLSQNVAIHITRERAFNSDIYVCDIRVSSAACIRRAFGESVWNRSSARVETLAMANDAILAMTGDSSANISNGFVLGNGHLYRTSQNRKRDLCVMYKNGEMKTFRATDVDMNSVYRELQNSLDDLWQVFLFGPALLDEEGRAYASFSSNVKPANPRSVIGYYSPGHYCFVQVDGRGVSSRLENGRRSTGLTLRQLADYMEALGCQCAYNLDGGQSSMLWFDGLISNPYNNGRKVGDVIMVVDLPPTALEND